MTPATTHEERIAQIKRWLGNSTPRNHWSLRRTPEYVAFDIGLKQHYIAVMRKVRAHMRPWYVESTSYLSQTLRLRIPDCTTCGCGPAAHAADGKCFFDPGYYVEKSDG